MKKIIEHHGFTLAELLVAVVILMIGFLGVLTVLWTSSRAGKFSRQMSTAANLNEDVMEQINTLDYTNSSISTTNGSFVNFNSSNAAATAYTRQIMVQDNVPAANTKTITVRISWKDGAVTKTRNFVMLKRQDF